MSITSVIITPPEIIPWITKEDRKECLVLLDVEADIETNKSLKIELNIMFNSIAVTRGILKKADYYVGCTGAEIHFELDGGE